MEKQRMKEKIIGELRKIAFADVTQGVQVQKGEAVALDTLEVPAAVRCAIASIKGGTKGPEVKFYDKLRALEILYKILDDDFEERGDDVSIVLQVTSSLEEVEK